MEESPKVMNVTLTISTLQEYAVQMCELYMRRLCFAPAVHLLVVNANANRNVNVVGVVFGRQIISQCNVMSACVMAACITLKMRKTMNMTLSNDEEVPTSCKSSASHAYDLVALMLTFQ
mmetsp:Transcript_48602/g.92965  ORF Transcript_48602/g.92965 Transcript_48602/m.92965 type:complete len:119 (+) Transcript_48602:1987-2343(+)